MDTKEYKIDLRTYLSEIQHHLKSILIVFFVTAIISITYSLVATKIYYSSASLTPADLSGVGSPQLRGGSISAIASLAGVNIGSGASDKSIEGMEILKSREFIVSFLNEYNHVDDIVNYARWDGNNNLDHYSKNKKTLSDNEVYRIFIKDHLSISQDPDTFFVSIGVRHESPKLAFEICKNIIDFVNQTSREDEISKLQSMSEYLKKEVISTNSIEMKELFYMLIQDQTQKLMIANGTKEFFFRIVKEPFIDDQRIHPKRSLIVIFNVFIVTFFLFLFIAVSLFFGFRVTFISKLPLIKFNKI